MIGTLSIYRATHTAVNKSATHRVAERRPRLLRRSTPRRSRLVDQYSFIVQSEADPTDRSCMPAEGVFIIQTRPALAPLLDLNTRPDSAKLHANSTNVTVGT